MRKIILYMQISLDGVVSDPDRWMTLSDEIVEDALAYYDTLDTIIVGGTSYPALAQYWQNAEKSPRSALEGAFAEKINSIRKIVISRSKTDLVWNNSRQLMIEDGESLAREIGNLTIGEGKNISVESGVSIWRMFLQHSLSDEMMLMVHPVVAAHGEKLFTDSLTKTAMRLKDCKVYKNGVVGLHYQRL